MFTDIVRDAVKGITTGERHDGALIKGVPPYRRLMAHIMRGRNESVVYFDTFARAEKLLAYIDEANAKGLGGEHKVDVTHCLVAALAVGLSENPKMNRFVVGRRLYQRRDRQVTFSMKRRKLGREAKLSAVKMTMGDDETFEQLAKRINSHIIIERSGKKTTSDREFDLFDKLPRSALDAAVSLFKGLDHYGALPAPFIDNDGMYTSCFIANLGSLGMNAGYHHLYEWGNCPLFMMVGQLEKRPLVTDDDTIEVRQVLPIRWSYDERIDDGLNARFGIDSVNKALENPYAFFGCLADDGSDAVSLNRAPLR